MHGLLLLNCWFLWCRGNDRWCGVCFSGLLVCCRLTRCVFLYSKVVSDYTPVFSSTDARGCCDFFLLLLSGCYVSIYFTDWNGIKPQNICLPRFFPFPVSYPRFRSSRSHFRLRLASRRDSVRGGWCCGLIAARMKATLSLGIFFSHHPTIYALTVTLMCMCVPMATIFDESYFIGTLIDFKC